MTACVERLYPRDQVSVPCFCFDVFLSLFQEKKEKRKKRRVSGVL